MKNPETVIRRYLDDHGGRVEAHIRHITDSWDLEDAGEDHLQAIRENLAEVGVATDPPLPTLSSDGRLTLYIAEGEVAAETKGGGTAVLEAEGEFVPEVEGVRGPVEASESEEAHHETRFQRKRFRRFARSSGAHRIREESNDAGLFAPSENGHDAGAVEADVVAASTPEVAGVLELVVGEPAQVGIRQRLEQLGDSHRALQDRLDQVGEALDEARRAAAPPDREAAEGLAALEKRLRSLSIDRPAELESLYRNLVQAEQDVAAAQDQQDTQAEELQQQLAEAQEQVSAARAAVNESLSTPEFRGELDSRVAALSDTEGAERDLQRRMVDESDRWAAYLPKLQAGVDEAREALGRALLTSERQAEDGSQPPDPTLAEAADALSEARAHTGVVEERLQGLLAAVERESAQSEAIRIALRDSMAHVERGVMDAALGQERRAAVQQELEAFMDAKRQELERTQLKAEEWLRSVRDSLNQTRAELEVEREQRAQAEQRESELDGRLAEIESTLAAARAEHEQRESELTGVRAQLDQDLSATRERLEATSAELEREREARERGDGRERHFQETVREVETTAQTRAQELEAAGVEKSQLQSKLVALRADLDALRSERDGSVASLNEAMLPVRGAGDQLKDARARLAQAQAAEERLAGEIETAEQQLQEKQKAVAESKSRQAARRERTTELQRELQELEEARGRHAKTAEGARHELATLQRELESAASDAARRAEEVAGRGRTVAESQRSAATALFADGAEAARVEHQLHDAIEREQESRRSLESHSARADELREKAALLERRIGESQSAEADALRKLEAHKAEARKVDDDGPEFAEAGRQAEESMTQLRIQIDELRSSLEEAKSDIAEHEVLVETRRAELQQAQEVLEQAVGQQVSAGSSD